MQRKDKMGYTTPTLSWINEIKESLWDDFPENLSDVLIVVKFITTMKNCFL
ncbi:MAG: hypothetical protein IPP56_01810 [Bacteroidetes bacterium]|nr:hypothetical protein [Bacteroidota bacterium]